MGRIDRPHGVRGEVVVTLTTNRHERVSPGSVLGTADGRTLQVEACREFRHRFIVRFAGVGTRELAEQLHGVTLFAERIEDATELWVHDLIGSEVVELDGTSHGRVEALEANPASDLLCLASGALVPLCFVVSFDAGKVVIDPPSGLFDQVD